MMDFDGELSLAFKRGLEDFEAGLADVLRLLAQARAEGRTEAELRAMKIYCTLLSKARGAAPAFEVPPVLRP